MNKLLSVLGSPRAGRFSSQLSVPTLFDDSFLDSFFSAGKTSFSDDKVRFNTTNKQFTCEIDLPGVKKTDLKITQEDSSIYINATRKVTTSGGDKEETYTRSFSFDDRIFDVTTLDAKLEDGVLKVTLQAKETPKKQVREITVN